MAYQFQNQQTATAQIARGITANAPSNYMKIAGINGLQTNANNFRTAIVGLVDIAGIKPISLDEGIRRNVNQYAKNEGGISPQVTIQPDTANLRSGIINGGENEGSLFVVYYEGKSNREVTLSGKKPAHCTIRQTAYEDEEDGKRRYDIIIQKDAGYTYTTGESYSANLIITVAAGDGYSSGSATLHLTSGSESDFVDV